MTPKLPFTEAWGQDWPEREEFNSVHGIEPEDLRRPLIEDECYRKPAVLLDDMDEREAA